MCRLPLLAAAILLILLFVSVVGSAAFRKEPYLIYPGEPDLMWIRWQMTTDATVTFEWGETLRYELGKLSSSPEPNRYHRVKLDGLSPATLYHYRVLEGDHSFTGTFRAAAQHATRNVTFYGLADTQYIYTSQPTFEALATRIGLPPDSPSFVLLAGDWVQTSGRRPYASGQLHEVQLNSLIAASHPLTSSLPLLGCLGNHDVERSEYRDNFDQAWPYPAIGPMYWSFDFGPVHVAVVDQYTDLSEGSAQQAWLLQDLSSARLRPWTIVLLHEPWNHPATVKLGPAFEELGVDLILAGHIHSHYFSDSQPVPLLVMSCASYCTYPGCTYVPRMFYEFEIQGSRLTMRGFDLNGSLEWEETITNRDPLSVADTVLEEPPQDGCSEPSTPEAAADEESKGLLLDLDAIEWQASINCDENPNTPGNDAWIVEDSDGFGRYFGMGWESPEIPDLSLNGLDRFDWNGVSAVSLTLAADAPVEVEAWVGVAGSFCGRNWRYAEADRLLLVTSEPQDFLFPASAFSEDPEGRCNGRLAEDALEGAYSIFLLPLAHSGELRVYEVKILESVPQSAVDTAIQASPADVWNGEQLPVLDDFSRSDGRSLGGTAWSLDRDAHLELAADGDGGGLLMLSSPETRSTQAELPLAGLPLGDFDGFYVIAGGSLGGLLEAEIAMICEAEPVESAAAFPLKLSEPIREFRIPFDAEIGHEPTGEVLRLELVSPYIPAEASIYEVGLYTDKDPRSPRATALVWITPMPPPVESTTRILAGSEKIGDLTFLGNPFADRFADDTGWENVRSVWDMQRWENRIYLAHGDGYSNAGPTDVWFYDPASASFVKETTIDEEEIRRFVVSDGSLFIPGFDPRESNDPREWALGNLYTMDDDGWRKLRTIPWGLHAYDVLSAGEQLFVSGDGSEAYVERGELQMAFAHVSTDGGHTWELHYPEGVNRVEELFELNGSVYASGAYDSVFLQWTGESFAIVDADPFPDLPAFTGAHIAQSNASSLPAEWRGDPATMIRASHATSWLDGVLYLCSFPNRRDPIDTNDFRFVPETLGVYYATAIADGEIQRLDFLPSGMMGRDIVVRDDVAYVLAVGSEIDSHRAAVYQATSVGDWEVVFMSDRMPGTVYSLEVAANSLLFGLGGPSTSSGGIYRFELP